MIESPTNLSLDEHLPVEIKILNYYKLHNTAIIRKPLAKAHKFVLDHVNGAVFKRCDNKNCLRNTIVNLDLEVLRNSRFARINIDDFRHKYLHLRLPELKYLLKKDRLLGMHAWSGDIMEELLQKVSLSPEDISAALSSVLNVIDKVNYCRYLPLEVILSRLLKYLQFAITKYADFKTVRKHIIDIVKVFVVRKDVCRAFIVYCPMDLKTFLMCAQKEKFETWDLWSSTEEAENEAIRLCFLYKLKNFITLLRFGGKSTCSRSSFLSVEGGFFNEIGPMEEKNYDDIDITLWDGPLKQTSFRMLQVLCLYLKNFVETPRESVEALKWLWGCITDPFLIYEDFMLIVDYIPDDQRGKVLQCWTWYEKHVSDSVQRIPRTLKHLSRCSIRSRLAQHFNLPNRLKELHLPKELLLYIEMPDLNIL